MAASRGSVKGTVFESRLAFLVAEGGDPLLTRVLARLPEADRRALTRVMPMAWYPFELSERLDLAIADGTGRGTSVFKVLGVHSAVHNLGLAHKVYVRDRDPHGLLKQAATIFRLYYDSGHRTYERVTPQRAVLRTHECLSFSVADCLTVVGWHEKAIELCGGKHARVTEKTCRATGGAICEYVCEWQ